MVLDPMSMIMFALIAVLIFFMFRNGKKRQAAMQELQNNLRPGAEVMLTSGIYATVESVDEEDNRVTVQSGTTTLIVHRNAVSQIVTPVTTDEESVASDLAPDDDPEFGERFKSATDSGENGTNTSATETPAVESDSDGDKPKA